MKTIYKLEILENDNYFRSHDYLSCEILKIEENSKRKTEHIVVVDGIETRRTETIEYIINGEYRQFSFSDEYFETLYDLKSHGRV